MSEKTTEKKTTLFLRILIRITIPLFFLATILVGILLTNQVKSMNRFYQVESTLIFKSVQLIVEEALPQPKYQKDPVRLKRKLQRNIRSEQNISVQIYDMFSKSPLFTKGYQWTDIDNQYAEKSLVLRKEKELPYSVRITTNPRNIVAYIPLPNEEQNYLFVTRVAYPLVNVDSILQQSLGTLVTMLLLIFVTGILLGKSLAKAIVKPITILNEATQKIMKGELTQKVEVSTGDELEELASAFNHMSRSLRSMKSHAEDANPLSQLPGNNAIKADIQQRILEKQKFVVFHTDLDRFKTFNDVYGLAKGDEAIVKTAELLKLVVSEVGSEGDFIGHQGGDDYVLVVKANKAKEVGEAVVSRFDEYVVKPIYPKEDYERGYTEAFDRRGMAERGETTAVKKRFPLLGLSLAGVSNKKKDFASYEDCLERATPVKKAVKDVIESSYLIQE